MRGTIDGAADTAAPTEEEFAANTIGRPSVVTHTHKEDEMSTKGGFTLIEVLVVVIILGLLATIVTTKVAPQVKKGPMVKTRVDIQNLRAAVGLYEMEYMKYPKSLDELLVEGDEDSPGPFIEEEELPTDGWGNKYHYEIRGKRFRITSPGPDGEMGTDDDIWK